MSQQPGSAKALGMRQALSHAEKLGVQLVKMHGSKPVPIIEQPIATTPPPRDDIEAMRSGKVLAPQPGPQEMFLSSPADIVIYGGAAGGGKSFALLLEPLRHIANPRFTGVIFRRTSPQITNEGGLWDTSATIYPHAGLHGKPGLLEWRAPGGGTIRMAHMQYEQNKLDWQGSQIPFIGFDELTHFTSGMFWYMLSRNRSTSGVRPYIRATTNPDANSWVADFISWWIDQDTGYPIYERAGIVRWFVRLKGEVHWGDTREELIARFHGATEDNEPVRPKSFTFIPSTVEDNKVLMLADPDYKGNLDALPPVERERLLKGNWKIRESAGTVLDRGWFPIIGDAPRAEDFRIIVRAWDTAATAGAGDWTVGVKLGIRRDNTFVILDVVRGQWATHDRKLLQRRTAEADGRKVVIALEQEPGSGGKDAATDTVGMLGGFITRIEKPSGDKVTRALPFAGQAQAGRVALVRAPWNEPYLAELHAFPTKGVPDDQIDASTLAFKVATSYEQAWSTTRFGLV